MLEPPFPSTINLADLRDIEALIDGELIGSEAATLCARMCNDPVLRAHFDMLNHQKTLLKAWWKQEERN